MKQWTCICGSKIFVLTRTESLVVNFNTEGAIEGHPHVSGGFVGTPSLVCIKCHTRVPGVVEGKILKEIV